MLASCKSTSVQPCLPHALGTGLKISEATFAFEQLFVGQQLYIGHETICREGGVNPLHAEGRPVEMGPLFGAVEAHRNGPEI